MDELYGSGGDFNDTPDQAPPQPAPSATAIASGPPRWTSSDDLTYARKSASLGQVQDDLDSGVLYPHDAAPLLNQLQGDLGAMDQRKAAFDAHRQQTATQSALGVAAMQRGVEQMDMQHRAAGFQDTMHMFVDPITNESTTFYQKRPGEWEPVPKGDQTPGTPGALSASQAGTADDPNAGAVASADPMAGAGSTGQTPAASSGGGEPFRQTIQNGPYTDQYENGRLVSTDRPQHQLQDAAQYGLDPAQLQGARQWANIVTMGMRPGPHRDVAFSRAMIQKAAEFHQFNLMQKRQDFTSQQQQAVAARQDHREQVTKVDAKYDGLVKEFFKDQQGKIDKLRHGTKDSPGLSGEQLKEQFPDNPEYWDAKAHDQWAKDQANRLMQISHPGWVPPDQRGKPASQGAQQSAPPTGQATAPPASPAEPQAQQPAAPKVEPLPPHKATLADVMAEIERRKKAKFAAEGGYSGPDLAGGLNTSLLGGP